MTDKASELLALAERCEKAKVGNRELDGLIEVEMRRQRAYAVGLSDTTRASWQSDKTGDVFDAGTRYRAPRYSASLDAAMTLYIKVPERLPSNPRLATAEALHQQAEAI